MWLATLSFAAETSWLVGEAEAGSRLQALLAPHADANVTVGAAVAFGAAGRSAGLAAASTALDGAAGLLEGGVRQPAHGQPVVGGHGSARPGRGPASPGRARRRRAPATSRPRPARRPSASTSAASG